MGRQVVDEINDLITGARNLAIIASDAKFTTAILQYTSDTEAKFLTNFEKALTKTPPWE